MSAVLILGNWIVFVPKQLIRFINTSRVTGKKPRIMWPRGEGQCFSYSVSHSHSRSTVLCVWWRMAAAVATPHVSPAGLMAVSGVEVVEPWAALTHYSSTVSSAAFQHQLMIITTEGHKKLLRFGLEVGEFVPTLFDQILSCVRLLS